MATRQRARTSVKAPALPATPIDPTAAADDTAVSSSSSTAEAHLIVEQVVYRSREARIAESAYLHAEARGFQPGYELEDWLNAERDVDALLSGRDYSSA